MNSWQKPYDTGWINRSDWTNVHLGSSTTKDADSNVTHNLNAPLSKLLVKVLISTDETDANSFEMYQVIRTHVTSVLYYGIIINQVNNNSLKIQTGINGLQSLDDNGGIVNIVAQNWYYKVKVWNLG